MSIDNPEQGSEATEPEIRKIELKPGEIVRLQIGPYFLNVGLETPTTMALYFAPSSDSPTKRPSN